MVGKIAKAAIERRPKRALKIRPTASRPNALFPFIQVDQISVRLKIGKVELSPKLNLQPNPHIH